MDVAIAGKVLWVSERDGNGIVRDVDGNEYYMDKSTIPDFGRLRRNDPVMFTYGRLSVDGILVVKKIIRG